MDALNYKHLRYFWIVAKTGSIARAAEQLHLTPQSISGQLGEFEERLGVELFRPSGRNRELTEAGRSILGHAETIFSAGDDLLSVLRDQRTNRTLPFRVGIADSVSKSVAYRLVEPVFQLDVQVHLVCREGRLASLLAELAIQRLDMIIADRPLQANLNIRGYSHLLGESGLTVFASAALAKSLTGTFPQTLDRAPFLLPGEDTAIRPKLLQWLEATGARPNIIGEFDDSALMKAFGQHGAGVFVAPSALATDVIGRYGVQCIGRTDEVHEEFFAISVERRIKHPCVAAIDAAARGVPLG